jgi:hypothetical protein
MYSGKIAVPPGGGGLSKIHIFIQLIFITLSCTFFYLHNITWRLKSIPT